MNGATRALLRELEKASLEVARVEAQIAIIESSALALKFAGNGEPAELLKVARGRLDRVKADFDSIRLCLKAKPRGDWGSEAVARLLRSEREKPS
jgi:hypothetical protein